MIQVSEYELTRLKGNPITIVSGGNFYLAQMKVPERGFISKTTAQQISGTSVAFTIDVLNSSLGLTPGEITSSALSAVAGWQMARIMAQIAGTSGGFASAFLGYGQPYRNMDGADPVRSGVSLSALNAGQTALTDSQRCMYLLLQPTSNPGGNSEWELAVTVWNNVK